MNERRVYVVVRVSPTLTVVQPATFLMSDGVRVAYRSVNSHGEEVGLVRGADVGDVYENEDDAHRSTTGERATFSSPVGARS